MNIIVQWVQASLSVTSDTKLNAQLNDVFSMFLIYKRAGQHSTEATAMNFYFWSIIIY